MDFAGKNKLEDKLEDRRGRKQALAGRPLFSRLLYLPSIFFIMISFTALKAGDVPGGSFSAIS